MVNRWPENVSSTSKKPISKANGTDRVSRVFRRVFTGRHGSTGSTSLENKQTNGERATKWRRRNANGHADGAAAENSRHTRSPSAGVPLEIIVPFSFRIDFFLFVAGGGTCSAAVRGKRGENVQTATEILAISNVLNGRGTKKQEKKKKPNQTEPNRKREREPWRLRWYCDYEKMKGSSDTEPTGTRRVGLCGCTWRAG